jgi:hypothetical protein
MDHYVSLARTTVGAAASVVTPLSVRVHADTLLFGGQRPNKGAAGPARSSTQPSSTIPWGATDGAVGVLFLRRVNSPLKKGHLLARLW